jgi:hypothetical protein
LDSKYQKCLAFVRRWRSSIEKRGGRLLEKYGVKNEGLKDAMRRNLIEASRDNDDDDIDLIK